jgi:hypothetical protein
MQGVFSAQFSFFGDPTAKAFELVVEQKKRVPALAAKGFDDP